MISGLLRGVVMLSVLGGGGALVLAKQAPSLADGLAPVAISAAAVASFDRKIEALNAAVAEAKKTGKAQPVEVTFTDQELTSKANSVGSAVNDSGLATSDTQVHLTGGNLVAAAAVTIQGMPINVAIVAAPVVVDGQTRVTIKELQTGALPIPDLFKQPLSAQLAQTIDPKRLGLPIEVTNLTILEGKLIIRGQAKP